MKIGLEFYLNIAVFTITLVVVFFVGLFVMDYSSVGPAVAQEQEKDTVPPKLNNIKITNLSATSTLVSWETDEFSDSLINYGLDKNYGILREPRFDKLEHSLILENLLPNTEYFFRVTSSDLDGNQGISSDYTFVTEGKDLSDKQGLAEEVIEEGTGGLTEDVADEGQAGTDAKDIEQTLTVAQVIEFIEQIIQEEGGEQDDKVAEEVISEIQAEVQQKAEEIVAPPTIILDYADVEVGTDYAIITWATDKESNTMVALVDEADYDENDETPYTWNEGFPDEMVLSHRVEVNGLDPATVYHFQVSSESAIGLRGYSSDKTFKTKSIQPEIYNLQVYKIEEEAATIRWSTNVPCSSVVEFTNLNNGETRLDGNASSFTTVHSIRLTNLVFDTYYSVVVNVTSEDGESAKSDPMAFITTRDQYAPIISKVSTESTIYPGSDNKIQSIVSWKTDEVAICQLNYHQGLLSVDEPDQMPIEEDYATRHVQVVTNFAPSTVYKFWIICDDETGNSAKSEDYTMLTPSQEESIIDIILKNFESSFGWVKKMGI